MDTILIKKNKVKEVNQKAAKLIEKRDLYLDQYKASMIRANDPDESRRLNNLYRCYNGKIDLLLWVLGIMPEPES